MKTAQFQLHADIEEHHWWFVARRRILVRLIHRLLPPAAGQTVVDVGCGTGANIAALADDYTCIGVDSSEEALAFARQRFPRVEFLCASEPPALAEVGRRTALFILSDVLEHLADDFQFFSELLAVVQPGAHLLLTVPAEPALWSPHDVSFGHYRRYTQRRLEQVWSGLPVAVRLYSFYNARLYPLVKAARWLNRLTGRTRGAAGTDFRLPSPAVNRLLTALFAGEGRALEQTLDGRRTRAYARGVSLIAVLRREPGAVIPRGRPPDVPPDARDDRRQPA